MAAFWDISQKNGIVYVNLKYYLEDGDSFFRTKNFVDN